MGVILQKNSQLSATSIDAPNVLAAEHPHTTKSLVPEILDNIFLAPGLAVGTSQSKGPSVTGNEVIFTLKSPKRLCSRQRPQGVSFCFAPN